MSRNLAVIVLSCAMTAFLPAQTTPSGITLVTRYTPVAASLGGIMFDSAGMTLYVADVGGAIRALPVVRNPLTNQISGFGPATFVTSASGIDGGLDVDSNGTFLWTTYSGHSIGQYTVTGIQGVAPLAGTGVPSSTGGMELVPFFMPNAGEVLVSSYSAGGIYKVTLTLAANGTYTAVPGSGVLFAATAVGAEGFTHIPAGPNTGHVLSANYNSGEIRLLQIDQSTGASTGVSHAVISGLSSPMDIAFDPQTNDFLVSAYLSSQNLYHFSGSSFGDYQLNQQAASFDINGLPAGPLAPARKLVAAGQPVTVSWNSTLVGSPFDLVLSGVPSVPNGLVTAGGQIVNIDLSNPILLAFGGFTTPFFPVSLPFVPPVGTITAQMVIADPGAFDGFSLSQAAQLDVVSCSYVETIDSTPVGLGNYPPGWSNGGGNYQCQVNTGPTPNAGTGPEADHSGGGNYIYCPVPFFGAGTFIVNLGAHAVAPGANADFWYHMFGATIGTLQLQEETAPGIWTPVWTLAGNQGTNWLHAVTPLNGFGGVSNLRFHYFWGGGLFVTTGDAAIDDFLICP